MSQLNPLDFKQGIDIERSSLEQVVPLHVIPVELLSKVKKFATPQGTVNVGGLINVLKEARDKNRNKRHWLFVAVAFFVVFMLVNMGLTFAVVTMAKESHVNSNGLLTQVGTNTPVSTGTARALNAITSETSVAELSAMTHITASSGETTISSEVQSFAQMLCPFGDSCLPEYPHALFIYTPDMIVVYHGPTFVITNTTERMSQAITLGGLDATNAAGRHLLSTSDWIAKGLIGAGLVVVVAGAAATAPVAIAVGIISGTAMCLTGILGMD